MPKADEGCLSRPGAHARFRRSAAGSATRLVRHCAITTTDKSGSLRAHLIGHWTLVSLTAVDGSQIEYPMGHDATGVISYDEAGHMAAQIMQAGRPRFASGDIDAGTFEELSAALTGYTAYFGTYSVDEGAGVVTHHVEGSLFPNWVGTDQRRGNGLDGGPLSRPSHHNTLPSALPRH